MLDWRKTGHQHQDPQQALPKRGGWFSPQPTQQDGISDGWKELRQTCKFSIKRASFQSQ